MRLNKIIVSALIFVIAGCGGMKDDIFPTGTDKRLPALPGTTGPTVGQQAPDFTASDTLGNSVTLSTSLSGRRGVVLYFLMWGCPTCSSHLDFLQTTVMPAHPDVLFFGVDYVSGTTADSRSQQVANGFGSSGIVFLADTNQRVLGLYGATMATTVVIDRNGVIRMNEDMKDGSKLLNTLSALP